MAGMTKAKIAGTPRKLVGLKAMLDEMLVKTGGGLTNRKRAAADAALGIAFETRLKQRRK